MGTIAVNQTVKISALGEQFRSHAGDRRGVAHAVGWMALSTPEESSGSREEGLLGSRQTHCHGKSEGVGTNASRQADVEAGGTLSVYLLGENGREQRRGRMWVGARGLKEKGRSNCLGEKGTSLRTRNDCRAAVVWAILGLLLINLKSNSLWPSAKPAPESRGAGLRAVRWGIFCWGVGHARGPRGCQLSHGPQTLLTSSKATSFPGALRGDAPRARGSHWWPAGEQRPEPPQQPEKAGGPRTLKGRLAQALGS